MPPNHIRAWRLRRGLKIEELAELAELSISTVSNIETSNVDFTGKSLLSIANALGVDCGALFRHPDAAEAFFRIWNGLRDEDRNLAQELLESVARHPHD